jgi:hypothetical protein
VRSITLARAALFAALAMILLAGFYLADNFAQLQNTPVLVLLRSVVPSVIWAGFFFTIYRSPASASTAAWITVVLIVVLEAVVSYISFQQGVSYRSPFGYAYSLSDWLLRLGWAVFMIAFALNKNHSSTRRIALLLAIISAPSALSTAYDVFNNGIGFLFGEMPAQALWRALITPAIRTIFWLSQILFLWTVWGKPERARSH